MYLCRVQIKNFRNFSDLDVALDSNIVMVGENRVGKSNFIFALRLVLDTSLPDSARQLKLSDIWDGHAFHGYSEEGENENNQEDDDNGTDDNLEVEIHLDFTDFDDDDGLTALLTDYRLAKDHEVARISYVFRKKDDEDEADFIFTTLLPSLQSAGTPLEEIAVLYRWANHGDEVANKALEHDVPIVRSDGNALVRRSSRLSRFIEAAARWVAGGWKDADPPFGRLAAEACILVIGSGASEEERLQLQAELIHFLLSTINSGMSTHEWLTVFRRQVLTTWRQRVRTITEEWDVIDQMIERTDPTKDERNNLPLEHFGGRIEGSGRLNLSTLHSAKGREFDVVIMFAVNNNVIPTYRERNDKAKLREARRLFYVGVTRARLKLHLVYEHDANSRLIDELKMRVQ